MDELARVLKALRDKPVSLQAAVDLLEREAPTPAEREHLETSEQGYTKQHSIFFSNATVFLTCSGLQAAG